MAERNYWVLCDDNCRFPAMTKEETINAIQQAVSTGTIQDIDAGFITKIQELNAQNQLQFWVGTTAEYNAITEKADNTLYLLTDDNTLDVDGIVNSINELQTKADNLATKTNQLESQTYVYSNKVIGIENGAIPAGKATNSTNAQKTDHSNANWLSGALDGTYLAGHSYEIYFEYSGNGYFFNVSIPTGAKQKIFIKEYEAPTRAKVNSVYLYSESNNGSYTLEGTVDDDFSLYDNATNAKYREIR